MGKDVACDIHCDVTMSNDVAMCTYHGIMPNCAVLLWVEWNKNKNKFMFDHSGLENIFVVFV